MQVKAKLSLVFLLSLAAVLFLVPSSALAAEGPGLAAGEADLGSLVAGGEEGVSEPDGVELGTQASSAAWHRLYGQTALDTMGAIVDAGGFARGGTVVLTTAGGYWDALTAAGLAGMAKAPILMTDGKSLSPQTRAQIKKLAPRKIVVCGGAAAVGPGAVSQARAAAGTSPAVVRCAGADAVGTAVDIYKRAPGAAGGIWGSTAFVCTNAGYWDALAAAPISYAKRMPIFLTSGRNSIDSRVVSAMKAGGIKSVWIVGGTAAVSDSVKAKLSKNGITVNGRLAGATAVETSEAVAAYGLRLGMKADRMGVATTSGYWDALAGAALCGRRGSVLVLVSDERSHSISGFVRSHAKEISDGYIFGGPAAVSRLSADALNVATGGSSSLNPSVIHSTPNSQRSERVNLTGIVREYHGVDEYHGNKPKTMYILVLPAEVSVVGTQYVGVSSNKIVLREGFSSSVGREITINTGITISPTVSRPEYKITMLWASKDARLVDLW